MKSPDAKDAARLRPVTCERCGDDDTGPWIQVGDRRFLCEACWEKRTT